MADRATPFGKYQLLERINVGGMAEVFRARTAGASGFEKIVAIKRILPSVGEDEEFIRMFVDEAKLTSQLAHSNLAQTFDFGKIGESYYLAMEYVPGRDLRAVFERLKRRGEHVPLALAATIVASVCEGLDYAHHKRDGSGRPLRLVHRDVSPQNIVVSFEGEVKLIDFGIAKTSGKLSRTQTGILKGKFGYMSPEQVRGVDVDRRSDLFAAGVVLYELCTGERLFTGTTDYSVLEKVLETKVPRPSVAEPGIPAVLDAIILKALARDPKDRHQSAAALAGELRTFVLQAQQKPVAREDVAAFMRELFSDELRHARATEEETPLSEADRTHVGPSPMAPPSGDEPHAEIIVRSKLMRPAPPSAKPNTRWRTPAAIAAAALVAVAWILVVRLIVPRRPVAIAAAAATASPKRLASIAVLSSPSGADVFVDGEPKGQTPAQVAIDGDAGHAIVLEKECYRSWQMAIAPGAAARRELAATLRRTSATCAAAPETAPAEASEHGFLSLRSRPAANVVIDGVDIGERTPLVAWPLRSGPHRVRLVASADSRELPLEIQPGETRSLLVELGAARVAPPR